MASFLKRLRGKADELAAGTEQPAGAEPADAPPTRPSARERGVMRRRLRAVARERELKMAELGGLVLELDRQGRENPELLRQRTAELRALDDEARALARALDQEQRLSDLVVAGISGTCANCGRLISTRDSFCAGCGARAGAAPAPTDATPASNGSHSPDQTQPTEELQAP